MLLQSDGIGPARLVSFFTVKASKPLNVPHLEGKLPVSLGLYDKSNSVSRVSKPRSAGKVPVKSLAVKWILVKAVKRPTELGIEALDEGTLLPKL